MRRSLSGRVVGVDRRTGGVDAVDDLAAQVRQRVRALKHLVEVEVEVSAGAPARGLPGRSTKVLPRKLLDLEPALGDDLPHTNDPPRLSAGTGRILQAGR
jgi:hypothetical protein